MDIALVTGADAGPGLAIARRLIGMGCRVYALATQFARNPFPHDDFITLTVNLADPAALTQAVEEILAREGHVSFVVHAARRVATPLLDSSVDALTERLHVGLLAPIALARATLPWLRKEKGHFLVLAWNGDGPAPDGPVTAAIEGGLLHFTNQLFDELRDDGIRATTVYARPNPATTAEAAFALDPQSAVNPEIVADAVEHLFRLRPSNVVSTLVIRPAANAETPRLPRSTELAGLTTREVQLPPRELFPREPEPIPTPKRARPADAPPPGTEDVYDDDEDEDEDAEAEWNPEGQRVSTADDRDGPDSPPSREPPRDSRDREDFRDQPRDPRDQPRDPRDRPDFRDQPRDLRDQPRDPRDQPRDPRDYQDSGPPRRDYHPDDDRGPRRARGGRGGRGRNNNRPREFSNNRRGDLRGPGANRPYPDAQRAGPPRGDPRDAPPSRPMPPSNRDDFRDDQPRDPRDRPDDYDDRPDAEHAHSRDDSFRTPHSDNEPDDAPNEDTDFDAVPRDDVRDEQGGDGPPGRPSSGRAPSPSNRDTDLETIPPSEDYIPSRQQGAPSRAGPSQEGPGGPAPRRHRGYGRRPPPGSPGRTGPDAD